MINSYIKKPDQCTDQEISDFKSVLLERSDINREKIDKRIRRAKYLAFCYSELKLIGIAAIKTATKGFKKRIMADQSEQIQCDLPDSEMGWLYVSENYRQKGIGGALMSELLKKVITYDLFSLTPAENMAMRQLLTNNNFVIFGDVCNFKNNRFILYIRKVNL